MSDIFVDVKERSIEPLTAEGTQYANFASMAIGEGSQSFRSDQQGIWLGAEKYEDAPFSVSMAGAVTMTSATITGYVEDVGGTYSSTATAAAAKVQLLPDANTGIVAYASNGTSKVFEVLVGGTNVGDVLLGDYAGGSGALWDQSASTLYIKGNITAGNISGVTITGSTFKTGTTGTRVELDSSNDDIRIYDSGNDEVFRLNDSGGYITYESKDSRNMNFVSAGGKIYFDDRIIITDSGGIEFTNTRSSALSYDWGIAPYNNSGNYGWVSEMEGGTWKFDMTAGVPT